MKSCKIIAVKIIIIFMALLTFNDVKAEALKHAQHKIRAALPMQTGFAEKDSEGHYIGYTYDYLIKISQYTNWNYEFVEVYGNPEEQSEKITEMFEKGEIDVAGPVFSDEGFSEYFDLTGYNYGAAYSTLSVLTENSKVSEQDYQTMKGLKIAVLKSDVDRIKELERFCLSNNITYELVECENDEELSVLLAEGRVDAALGISTFPLHDTRVIAKFCEEPFYFAAAKGNFFVLNGLNMALNKIDQTDPYFSVETNKKYFMNVIKNLLLTESEKEYIKENPVLIVVGYNSGAPIQYFDENGKIQGISKNVMEKISAMTGFKTNYVQVDSYKDIYNVADADIIIGNTTNYSSYLKPHTTLSQPFLKTSLILFMRADMISSKLEDMNYGAVIGSKLPEGVEEKSVIYFETLEELMKAVENGKVDYGYGNAYSVSFYAIRNRYKNIVMVPNEQKTIEYSIGFINEDKLLESIINKSISTIDHNEMHDLILEASSTAERKVTVPMILETYKVQVSAISITAIAFIMIFIFYIIKTNAELKIKNKRYTMLAEISNEYFFEYDVKKDILILSEKSASLLGTERKIKGHGNSLKNHPVDVFHENSIKTMKLIEVMQGNNKSYEIEIPFSDRRKGYFKVINTNLYGNNQKIEYVVGKLIDISEEVAEKKALIRKAQVDGMTGLYNATSTREKIKKMLAKRQAGTVDAFILLDVDFFKEINDNYGHYTGDRVLQNLSETIRKTFRKTDVVGRFGGDEFCIYMQSIPSEKFVKSRCGQLNEEISNSVDGMNISLSIGISLVDEKKTFDEIYKEADLALYDAKRNGKNQFAVYEDKSNEK